MEISILINWLKHGGDYDRGVQLYTAFGTNDVYKRLFALPQTPLNFKLLKQQLQAIADALPVQAVSTSVAEHRPSSGKRNNYNKADLPENLRKLHDELAMYVAERSALHSNLLYVQNDALDATALRIKHLTKNIRNGYKFIDEYNSTGVNSYFDAIPATVDVPKQNERYYYLINQRQLASQNISKHKLRNNAKKLQEWIDKKAQIQKQIDDEAVS